MTRRKITAGSPSTKPRRWISTAQPAFSSIMSDLIRIVDLEVWAHLGVPEVERAAPQRLLFSLEMEVDGFARAATADDVALTVDYFTVAQCIKAIATERPRQLLETLAEEIAANLLKNFPIQKLTLEIKKFILLDTQYVSVKIERKAT
jgi:7,8-dihydroneopterin aldolase/epimerase/oxygenase